MKTAPQKERTGAPDTSWKPYQPAATSRAVASSAVTIAMTVIPAGRGPGSIGPVPGTESAGSEGFTGGLDTLAPYRT